MEEYCITPATIWQNVQFCITVTLELTWNSGRRSSELGITRRKRSRLGQRPRIDSIYEKERKKYE